MQKIAKKLLDENQITQEEYEVAKDMTKEAFLGELGHLFANAAGKIHPNAAKIRDAAQAAALTGIAGMVGMQAIGKAKDMINSHDAYNKMIAKMPDLSEYPEEQIKDFYSVVKTFSPKAAANPLVAGALVNKMLQFGGVDHKLVQDIANIEGDKKDILSDIVSKAGQSFIGFDFNHDD
jgi:hypothetical protein